MCVGYCDQIYVSVQLQQSLKHSQTQAFGLISTSILRHNISSDLYEYPGSRRSPLVIRPIFEQETSTFKIPLGKKKKKRQTRRKEGGRGSNSRPQTRVFWTGVLYFFSGEEKHRIAHGSCTRDTRHTARRAPKLTQSYGKPCHFQRDVHEQKKQLFKKTD